MNYRIKFNPLQIIKLQRKPARYGLAGLIGLMLATGSSAVTHYVRTPETCTNTVLQSPYTSWANAATNIITALGVTYVGETCLVSNGTYYVNATVTVGNSANSNIVFQSVNGPEVTIINGSGTSRGLYGGSWNYIISGFTITNCYKSDDAAGIYLSLDAGMNPTVTNCIITGNRSDLGPAVRLLSGSPIVRNCIIRGNRTTYGGIYCAGNIAGDSYVVRDCVIEGNTTSNNSLSAGAMRLSGTGLVYNCTIANNTMVGTGGGGIRVAGAGVIVSNCVISNNSCPVMGGGVIITAGLIQNCQIMNNSASNGGAIYFTPSSATYLSIRNCLLSGNVATNVGGGIYSDASAADATGTIYSCTIVDNASTNGGGMYVLYDNGLHNYAVNNIIWSNRSSTAANGDIYTADSNIFTYTCASYGSFRPNAGNTTNNPLMVSVADGNYRINKNSPCVNTGTNQSWMTDAADLDGKQRIRYGTVDMGAYECIAPGTMYSFY